jgi:uncharacterized protein (DUF1800 family)
MRAQPGTESGKATIRTASTRDDGAGARIDSTLTPIKPAEFGYEQARHLLWRAGFGGTPQQIQTLASWGPEKSVDYLLEFDKVPAEGGALDRFSNDIMRPPSEEERRAYNEARRSGNEDRLAELRRMRQQREGEDRRQMAEIQKWWLKRMIETGRPLEEKLTLFWHGHFATNYRTIEDSFHMLLQNELFRREAAGSFERLLRGIIRDPAMIAYLDNNDSRKGRPNENLAREIMELFALGIGNYTEQDIKEGARALTGYTFRDDAFYLDERNHDTGMKRILGASGNLNGDEFVDAILARPECSQFVARKLYHFFVEEIPTPERARLADLKPHQRGLIGEMARSLAGGRYEVKPVLRRLFLARSFYHPRIMNQQIKSPVELVVGAVRSLNAPVRDLGILNDALDLMGQNLFMPPSVKGWDGGRSWVNTSTMFVRQNIMAFLLTGKKPQGYDSTADTMRFDPMPLLGELAKASPGSERDPQAVADYLLRLTVGVSPQAGRDAMASFISKANGRLTPDSVTGMLLLCTSMPEYQLC